MQRSVYRAGLIMIVLATLFVSGCGSSDGPLDEMGQRYTASLTVLDLDEETLQVDVVQDICSINDGIAEYEDFSDALGEITITSVEGAAGLTLQSYSIEYTPLGSVDSSNITQSPPELTDPPAGFATVNVPANSTVTFTITLITVDTKAAYTVGLAADAELDNLLVGRYLVRVTLHFEDESGNDKDITVDRTVLFSDYLHC